MNVIHKILILLFGVAISVQAVPPVLNYAGQVAVNGEAFNGNGLFKFALVNTDGTTTYWSNDGTSVDGSESQASVSVPVNGGLYSILLGNTAQQGMGAIDPAVFAQHTDAKLRVWFSDGVNGFQQLSPDRPFASVPYAFSAGNAQSATIADGSINKAMLGSDVLTDLNAPIGLNRLSTEVTAKLDKNATIGLSSITKSMLAQEVLNDLNGSTTIINPPVVGSIISFPSGQPAPAGYSLYQQGEPKLVWEEKAPVSVARYAYDGVEVLGGKIYFTGGAIGSAAKNIAERYDLTSNTWETLNAMSINRRGIASSVLNDKLYVIGGVGLSSVEIFDPLNDNWVSGVSLPGEVQYGTSITINGKIYLVGGRNASEQNINQVLCFDPATNQWSAKANMPTARHGIKLVLFENRIWAIGGYTSTYSNRVESYDPTTNSWQNEASLTTIRHWPVAWVANGRIYVGGGLNGSFLNSIESYDPISQRWTLVGYLPEKKDRADAVVYNNKLYLIAGRTSETVYSKKVFAADLNASMEGVYDLYRKDGNASTDTPIVQAEVADGSVTTAKLDATILKYLKPEITAQPKAETVYVNANASFSVNAEGKYLNYQWKKNGVDLTGETNATLNITDANATLHDGNYSVVVSNDFGSVESGEILVDVNSTWSTDGLIAWYPLDQNASDISGLGNHGTLKNTPQFVTQDGKSFVTLEATNDNDDTGDHILLPFSSFSPFTRITISGWLNFINSSHSNNHSASVISFGDHEAGILAVFALNSGANSFFQNTTNRTTLSLRDVQNTWVHFVITGNQEMCNGYLNGENIGTGSGLSSYSGGNAAIGRDWWGNGSSTGTRLNGSLDEIRIYDRALSAAEVQALYNMGQ